MVAPTQAAWTQKTSHLIARAIMKLERKQEELRPKDELEIHLEDVKKDAMDRFDRALS